MLEERSPSDMRASGCRLHCDAESGRCGCFTLPQVLEVHIGDHLAGQVAFALDTEDLVFKVDEAATIEPQPP